MCCACAAESKLILPTAVTHIEEQTFYADTALEEVVLPEGITRIGPQAFAYSNVKWINFPKTLTFISEDAFEGCKLEMVVAEGDYGKNWCKDHGIRIWEKDPYAGEEDIL